MSRVNSSHVPSRLEGIETYIWRVVLKMHIQKSSHVPSRLEGIETIASRMMRVAFSTVRMCLPVWRELKRELIKI